MSILGTVATARTWLTNFTGPCLWLAGLAGLAGAGAGGWAAWKIQDGRVARAELRLSELKASLATESNRVIADNAATERANMAAIMASMSAITARIDAIPAALRPELARTTTALRSLTNAPQYDCLRLPYPADALRLLQQPDGNAASDPDPH